MLEEKYTALLDAIEALKKEVTEVAIQKMIHDGLYSIDMDSRRELDSLNGMMATVFDRFMDFAEIDGELRKLSLGGKTYSYRVADQPVTPQPVWTPTPPRTETVETIKPVQEISQPVTPPVTPPATTEAPAPTQSVEVPVDEVPQVAEVPQEETGGEIPEAPEVPEEEAAEEVVTSYDEDADESRKVASEFVFDKYLFDAAHANAENYPQEITVYVAPLKISQTANPNVPILVTAISHGKSVSASSLDTAKSGRALVTIDIDDFHLLCRGSFDANGKFVSYVLTTGDSATQGDILTLKNKESGANGPVSGSGHIRLHGDDGSVTEIFPLSLTESEYVVLEQAKDNGNSSFLDYIVVSKTYGVPKAIFFESGVKKHVVAGWEGQTFEAEVIY